MRNGRSSDDFQSILLEVQEIVAKFSPTHAILLLGDMNSSLQKRDNNLHDRELENFCMRNGLSSLQRGTPTFFHVNTKDTADADVFKILGVMPSRPVAFVTSSDFNDVMLLVIFMRGIPNWTVFGIFVLM